MIRKIAQYSLSTILTIMTSVLAISLFIVIVVGAFVGLFVELFKLHSRISNLELKKYKIAKPIEKDTLILKPKKVFKLPHFPEKVRNKRVFLLMKEKELSEAR